MKKIFYALLVLCGLFNGVVNAMDRNGCLQKTQPVVSQPKENSQDTTSQTTNTRSQSTSYDQARAEKRTIQIIKHFEVRDK